LHCLHAVPSLCLLQRSWRTEADSFLPTGIIRARRVSPSCTCSTGALIACKTSMCAPGAPLGHIARSLRAPPPRRGALEPTRARRPQAFTGVRTLLAGGNQIAQLKGLQPLGGLRHLDLSHNRLTAVDGLHALARLDALVRGGRARGGRSGRAARRQGNSPRRRGGAAARGALTARVPHPVASRGARDGPRAPRSGAGAHGCARARRTWRRTACAAWARCRARCAGSTWQVPRRRCPAAARGLAAPRAPDLPGALTQCAVLPCLHIKHTPAGSGRTQ